MSKNKVLSALLLPVLAVIAYLASFMPSADWIVFYQSARSVLGGESPYAKTIFMNPPWAILPVLPMALFPFSISRGIMFAASLLILFYFFTRLHAPLLAVIAFLASPTVLGALLVANIDLFVIAGLAFAPVVGLILLVEKPQISIGLVFYDLVDAWREGGFWSVFRTFAPVSGLYLVSALIFPVWIDRMLHQPADIWNRSLFPYAIPLGVLLMFLAFRHRNPYFALAAGVFFSPYQTFYTYMAVQIGLLSQDVEKYVRRDVLQLCLCIFLWVVMLVFKL